MTRRLSGGALALLALAALGSGCADGDLGAVSVRWRLTDLSTGVSYDPMDRAAPDGSGACACAPGDVAAGCGTAGWRVDRVRLEVTDPVSGAPVPIDDRYVLFPCRQREATTPFQIPPGTWALSLRAYDPANPARDQGSTPAPAVREVRKAAITTLDVIQIAVSPLPSGPDGGTDAGTDGGADLGPIDATVP